MKNLYPALPVIALVLVLASCNEEPQPVQKRITIDFTVASDEGFSGLPPDSRLVLNIETASGEPAMEYQEVPFSAAVDGTFSTEPLELPYGNYVITDVIIVNADDDILYAAPKVPGSLSSSVEHPLDFNFVFSGEGQTFPNLRLMDVRRHKPGDFGYASFRRPGAKVNVVVTGQDTRQPISARAFIVNGADTVARYTLAARVNRISLPARAGETAELVIAQQGYAGARFPLSEIAASHRSKSLKVELAPAFTMLAFIGEDGSSFEFNLSGPKGASVMIDWGDGSEQSFELEEYASITHPYTLAGNYSIAIKGDIDKITLFHSYYGYAMVDAFDFTRLTNLRELDFGLTRSPATIDLRHNSRLEAVELIGLDRLKAVHLPKSHRIHYLSVTGPNNLTTRSLDAIVTNVYHNTSAKNIRDGLVSLGALWYADEGDETLVGPPSPTALANLKEMKESYGWTIAPDPFE